MDNKNPVVHFEMPYSDAKRVSKFYKEAFGWGMSQYGEDMGFYVVAQTAETDDKNMVKTPGTINGGFYDQKASPKYTTPSVVISVNDIYEAIQDVKNAGGEIVSEPEEIPKIGLWAVFKDTEGNRVSVLQPKNM